MLELIAIWTIVIATFVWFFRDERRIREQRLMARARHYATAPAYRHRQRR